MLSLSCFSSLNSPTKNLLQQQQQRQQQQHQHQIYSLLAAQRPKPSKPKTTSRTRGRNAHSFLCKTGNSNIPGTETDVSRSEETRGNDPSGTPSSSSATKYVNFGLLAGWIRSCYRPKDIKRVHAVVVRLLKYPEPYVNNNLISVYVKLGRLVEARKVFDGMPQRNVVSWTAIINGYFNFGLDDEGLRLFSDCVENGVVPNGKTFVCVLNTCGRRGDFELGRQVHACVVKGRWTNLIVDSAVVYFYAQCGELESAFAAFNRMEKRDVVCWTTLITACSQQGCGEEAFRIFSQMLSERYLPNEFTVCGILKACGDKKGLMFGRQLHGAIVKKMYKDDVFIGTSLVDMYAKCGEVVDSRNLFNGMRKRNTVTWTSMIAGYARLGLGEEAINLFRIMKLRKVLSNNLTVVSILKACGSIGASLIGKEVHARILKYSIESNEYLGSTLVWFYCKCGESRIASKVFHQMPRRDVFSWTAIISGYAYLGHEPEALEFLKRMMEEGVEPDSFTYSSALKACANLEAVSLGRLIHTFANKTPASSNVVVGTALIHMYAKCGYISEATQVFDGMPERNLVSWKAMTMGYTRNGMCGEAMKLMYRMRAEGIEVDDYIFARVVGACGDIECESEPSSSSEYCLHSC